MIIVTLIVLLLHVSKLQSQQNYTIGVISVEKIDAKLADLTSSLNLRQFQLKQIHLNYTENPIDLTLSLCDTFEASLYTIISILPNAIDNQTLTISYLCSYYQIPFISLYNRESIFIDKSVHTSFIRMTPSYLNEARIWINLLNRFQFKTINFIHSVDDDGKLVASNFQYLADQYEISIEKEIEFIPNEDNFTSIARNLAFSTSKVIVLQAKSIDAERIMKAAEEFSLTEYGYVWIVNEEAFDDLSVFKLRNGVITAKYVEQIDPLYAALTILKNTFKNIGKSVLDKKPPKNCNENGLQWNTGKSIYDEFIKPNKIKFNQNEKTGEFNIVEFDDEGDLLSAKYDILNVQSNRLESVGFFKTTSNETVLNLNESKITWPGDSMQKPDGTKWSMKLKIVTIEEKPFIFKFERAKDKTCSDMNSDSIDCPWNTLNQTVNYCCYGYCIDLIKRLSQDLAFEFNVYIVPDGAYGDYDSVKGWNGLMHEVLTNKADMILAPFTINPERAVFVDFTKPFKYQGITILVKRANKDSSFASFLQPFKDTLWVMVMLSVHVVAVVLYLLDRFSPFGRFKLSTTEHTEEDALNLSRALWFTWGVLLNSGIGEGTPRSFSARVLGMVWAGFAMIMVASYTANLAAFLVLDRPEASISGINDARLRNPQDGFKYATVRGSAVEKYFKRQVELSTMYRTMENKNLNNTEEALRALRTGGIHAFIWDSARLEYEASQSCDFVTAGELFGRSSYGLALRKGNPWTSKLSLCILSLHERGYMEDLDSKWILSNNTSCQERDSSPSTLGLTNMAGVFMLVAGGIVMGIFLIFIEIAYKRYKDKKVKQHEVSRNAFATWRKNIEKRKLKKTSLEMSNNQLNSTKSNNSISSKTATNLLRPLSQMATPSPSLYSNSSLTQQNKPAQQQLKSNNTNHKMKNDLNV